MNSIVLGHPYSGALYAYFSDELGGSGSHTKSTKHPYYRTLYGSNYQSYVELALTFLLLYDEVFLTPEDNHMPVSALDPDNRGLVPELGLNADWDAMDIKAKNQREACVERYLDDPGVKKLLGNSFKIPQDCWYQIVRDAVSDAGLAVAKRCPLLCSSGRRLLIETLVKIDRLSLHPTFATDANVAFVEGYRTVIGMALKPRNIDHLMIAKQDKNVRTYGKSFLDIATNHNETDIELTQDRMHALIREAIETEETSKLFSGALNWASSILRFADFGSTAALSKIGAYSMTHFANNAKWFEFSGSIDRAIEREALLKKIAKNDELN